MNEAMPEWLSTQVEEHKARYPGEYIIRGFNLTPAGNAFVDVTRDGAMEQIYCRSDGKQLLNHIPEQKTED